MSADDVVEQTVGGAIPAYTRAKLRSHGFLEAQERVFLNQTAGRSVSNSIDVFRNPAGARWAYGVEAAHPNNNPPVHPLALPRVGQDNIGFGQLAPTGYDETDLFQRGRYVIRIDVQGAGVQPHQVSVLASIVDSRVRISG